MDIKPKFKQTEIGWIPKDWRVQSLRDLGYPVRGSSPRPAGDPRYFSGSFIPWLTVASLTGLSSSKLIVTETSDFLTAEGAELSRTLMPGTLIIANSGATLGVAKLLGIKCCANDGIAALLNLSKDADPRYLAYFINTKTDYLRNHVATGNGQPNLNTKLIGNFKLPLPPMKAEQEAIAGALGDADTLIDALEQLVAKKRQIKLVAMHELLTGRKRLPGFRTKWDKVRITDVAKLESGHTPSRREPRYWNGGVPWVSLHDSKKLEVNEIVETELTVSELGLANSSARLLPAGTVVFSRTATIGKSTVLGLPMATSQDFANYICGSRIHNHFLVELFRSMSETWTSLMAGSTHNTIYMPTFRALEISLPPIDEQISIVGGLRDMDAEITAIEAKLAKARQVKQGMMQELLTGRIRLV
ncbi:MAG: hypothetical protein C0483_04760 [Pirellula sp.]|nr:hypothetical protein [Pirellula sp.]